MCVCLKIGADKEKMNSNTSFRQNHSLFFVSVYSKMMQTRGMMIGGVDDTWGIDVLQGSGDIKLSVWWEFWLGGIL